MNREAQDSLLLLVGAMVLQVGITDLHLRYVKPQMQPLLLLTGAGLVLFGLLGVLRQRREERSRTRPPGEPAVTAAVPALAGGDGPAAGPAPSTGTSGDPSDDGHRHDGHGTDDGHEGHRMPRAAWLLVLPLLVMATVAPPTLGAFAASRGTTVVEEPDYELPALGTDRAGAVDLSLTDYYARVLYDPDSLQGRRVRLSGFVTPVGDDWFVSRIRLSCCAADGRPVNVLTGGPASRPVPAADTWVEVVGTAGGTRAPDGSDRPVASLEVTDVRTAPRPQNAYEP